LEVVAPREDLCVITEMENMAMAYILYPMFRVKPGGKYQETVSFSVVISHFRAESSAISRMCITRNAKRDSLDMGLRSALISKPALSRSRVDICRANWLESPKQYSRIRPDRPVRAYSL
jgi:hypothetical protein